MVARYSASVSVGAIVTAALIWWMQLMIAGGDAGPVPKQGVRLTSLPELPAPPPPPKPSDRPPPPPQATPLPGSLVPAPVPVRGPAGPIVAVGPPALPGTVAGIIGSGGLRAADGELMLVAQVQPLYPYAALKRELEGVVIVEFTVTERGTVSQISIVEASHPLFERAALTAVEKFRYQPRIVDGRPAAVPGVRAEIVFELEN